LPYKSASINHMSQFIFYFIFTSRVKCLEQESLEHELFDLKRSKTLKHARLEIEPTIEDPLQDGRKTLESKNN